MVPVEERKLDGKLKLPFKKIFGLRPGMIAGMSEIRDRANPAPAKSRNFRDGIFPASGKKFRSVSLKPPVSSV